MSTPPEDMEPARLRASAFIRGAEDRMRRVWFRSLTRWMDRTRPEVTAGDRVAPENVAQNAAYWGELVDTEVLPEVRSLMNRVRRRVRPAEPEALTDPETAAYLNQAGNRLRRVPDEVYALIVREIETGIAQSEGVPAIRDRVQRVLTATGSEYWPNRAVTVARTEVMGAVNGAAYFAAVRDAAERGDPAPFKVWLCVSPDTVVQAGPIQDAARRHYVGPLVRIATASGLAVSVTPEHPVLTGRGWLAAHLVSESDHLFRVPGTEAPGTPDVQHAPPGIGQVVDALMDAEPSQVRTVQVGVDLHRNAVNGDIQVVPVNGHLPGHGQPCLCQRIGDLSLVAADALAHVLSHGGGAGGELLGSHTPATELGAGGLSLTGLELGGLTGGPDESGRTLVPDRFPEPLEDDVHRGGRAVDFPAHSSGGETRSVEPDNVVGVKIVPFSGHVYDLTTVSGWYVANSLLLHNSTDDARTRPTHREADGQRTLLTEPFRVGGAALLFPGDPRGPAQEIIMCRCSLLPVILGETLDWTHRAMRRP